MRVDHWLMRVSFLCLVLILAACGGSEPEPTLTPTASATASETPSPVPSSTHTPLPSATLAAEVAEVTAEPTDLFFALPAPGQEIDPPLDINLPEGWVYGNGTRLIEDVDMPRLLPFTVYEGPVTGGTGQIIVLWGFPQVGMGTNPLLTQPETRVSLWSDGLRLLRLAVFGFGCNIGTDVERNFRVGGEVATGALYSAVNCPDGPDTRGWFAGIQKEGVNFLFYMSSDPITAMDGPAAQELQDILDTIVFDIDRVRPTATATATP